MTTDNPIVDLLSAPLGQEWTIDLLAEQILDTIAEHASHEIDYIFLDDETISDRQSRRLLRPLLACLATKSAAEAGISPNIFKGRLSFMRKGANGPVWISGSFENTSTTARIALHRSTSTPISSQDPSLQTIPPSRTDTNGPAPGRTCERAGPEL